MKVTLHGINLDELDEYVRLIKLGRFDSPDLASLRSQLMDCLKREADRLINETKSTGNGLTLTIALKLKRNHLLQF